MARVGCALARGVLEGKGVGERYAAEPQAPSTRRRRPSVALSKPDGRTSPAERGYGSVHRSPEKSPQRCGNSRSQESPARTRPIVRQMRTRPRPTGRSPRSSRRAARLGCGGTFGPYKNGRHGSHVSYRDKLRRRRPRGAALPLTFRFCALTPRTPHRNTMNNSLTFSEWEGEWGGAFCSEKSGVGS